MLSLAANIPADYEVNVLDAASRGLSLNETIEEIERWQPDILGLSVVTYRACESDPISLDTELA